ncbi:MAG: lysylphosphatidylglycerol synthase transmembrane domain-containing protein, partial [Planctomycetota bacterium]
RSPGHPNAGHANADHPNAGQQGLGRRVLLAALLGLVVYAALALHRDARGVLEALGRIPAWAPLVVCGLSAVNYAVRFPRWQRYLTLVGSPTAGAASARIYLSGLSLTVSPGKIGEAIKSWELRRADGTPLAKSAPIVLAERVTDLFGFLALIVLFGAAQAARRAPSPVEATVTALALAGGLAAVALVAWSPARDAALGFARRLPLVGRRADRGRALFESGATLLAPRELPRATALAALGWGLECFGAWLLARSVVPGTVAPELGFASVGDAFAVSAVAGAVVVIAPGGLGVTEGLLAALLARGYAAHGFEPVEAGALALSVTLVVRLCTLWFGMLVGLVALGLGARASSEASPADL